MIQEVMAPLCRHYPDAIFYERALNLYAAESLGCDALIFQATLDTDCENLYSEDMQAGRQYGSEKIAKPFA